MQMNNGLIAGISFHDNDVFDIVREISGDIVEQARLSLGKPLIFILRFS